MIKVAIFTEGQTEQLFACHVITKLADGSKYYGVNLRKNGRGDKLIKMNYGTIGVEEGHDIYFQILNCDSDNQVLSTLREEYESLVGAGFQHIIGMRDLYPLARAKLDQLRANVQKYVPAGPVTPLFNIAIMEIEAWFIAENTHFTRLDRELTPGFILDRLGFDVEANSELYDHPAELLAEVYSLRDIPYGKTRDSVADVVAAIDVSAYDAGAGERAPTIAQFIAKIRSIFAN